MDYHTRTRWEELCFRVEVEQNHEELLELHTEIVSIMEAKEKSLLRHSSTRRFLALVPAVAGGIEN